VPSGGASNVANSESWCRARQNCLPERRAGEISERRHVLIHQGVGGGPLLFIHLAAPDECPHRVAVIAGLLKLLEYLAAVGRDFLLCRPLSRSTTCRGHAGRAGQEKGGIGAVEKLFLLPVSLAGAAAAVACRSRKMKLVPPKAMSAMSSAER
jgi:hypothetical protein